MMKSIAAFIAVLAQLTAWLKQHIDKQKAHERERRNDEIESSPADKFVDKFGGADGVHNAGSGVLPEQASADADTDAAKRDRAE